MMFNGVNGQGCKRIFVCALVATLALGSSASAQTVTLDIEGTLAASCSLTGLPGGNFDLGDISKAGSKQLDFKVDCNAPFAYALVSQFSGLNHWGDRIASGSLRFASTVNYTVSTNFNTDAGSFGDRALEAATLTNSRAERCFGRSLSADCPFSNSGTGAAAAGQSASLLIDWKTSTLPLLAGTYQDILILAVRART